MQLIIDSGNSYLKLFVYSDEKAIDSFIFEELKIQDLKTIFQKYPSIQRSIICSVSNLEENLSNMLAPFCEVLVLTNETPLPIVNTYKTPDTLGKDRMAAAIGAKVHFPSAPVLVIDAGTCITYDIVNATNEFIGGSISPGIPIRLKALHQFTQKLPLLHPAEGLPLPGTNTEESILSGVIMGALFEMDGFISYYTSQYPDLKTVLSGGDMKYFDKKLKNSIFAIPNIVAEGLQKILYFNANTK